MAERIYVVGLSTGYIITIRSPDARSIGAFTVKRDKNGNIAANDAGNDITYTFNWDNKLRKAEWPTDTSSIKIKYDPFGNRVWKKYTTGSSPPVETEHKYIVAPYGVLDITGELPVVLMDLNLTDSSLKKKYIYADRKEPPGQEPVPDYLNWDLWLGPAVFRPYHREWMDRNLWRDFGTCQLGNWASHSANLAFMALKVNELWHTTQPGETKPIIRIKAEFSGINRLSFPRWEVVRWEIPARAELPPITFTWHNGAAPGSRERIEDLLGDSAWGGNKEMDHAGAIIVGTDGTIHATGHNATFRILPEDKFNDIKKDEPMTVDRSRGHEMDWLTACRGGKPAWSDFDYASALNEFLMLGNVATQSEDMLEFDPISTRIINNTQADALLRSEYREGWYL